jgi:hypothetical protein
MTDHPTTPPPELLKQWREEWYSNSAATHWAYESHLAARAAQWGADQELEACCNLLTKQGFDVVDDLRAARRPKPPSLNSIALEMLETIEREGLYINEITDTIRRALNQLPDS